MTVRRVFWHAVMQCWIEVLPARMRIVRGEDFRVPKDGQVHEVRS